MENKRLFLGMEVVAPWPEELPSGRILLPEDRHVTLAFLGDTNLPQLQTLLDSFPKPPFEIGLAGYFDHPLFLPESSPHVAAWHIHWLEQEAQFFHFREEIVAWLQGYHLFPKKEKKRFVSHVTIARSPFVIHEWKHSFVKRPLFIRNIHLCESLGFSRYEVCWTYPILAPFEEKEHTADIAFVVRGKTMEQIHLHAQLALSFHDLKLLKYFSFEKVQNIDEIVQSLNRMISLADQAEGCSLKAVSYHGNVQGSDVLEWEMIVDV